MPTAEYKFPAGFLWGTSTASHQVEGGNENNSWAAWEKQPGRIINGDKAGLACDWWGGHWKEDFDNAADTGQNAHRLSIEWSRIQPSPDSWDEEALDYYRQMTRNLVDRNIMPMVTLHHFSDPLWLVDMDGWENPDTPRLFEMYTRKVVSALKDYVTLWCTINEPNVYTYSGYIECTFPPGKSDMKAAFNVLCNFLRGHAAAYHAIHEIQPTARVGYAAHYRSFIPASPSSILDRWAASLLSRFFNSSFSNALLTGKLKIIATQALPEVKNTMDYFGLNYYTRDLVNFTPSPSLMFHQRAFPPGAPVSETGFIASVPAGFMEAIKWAYQSRLPLLITENGIEDRSDNLRPQYLIEHLHQIWHATNHNIPIKGYFYWSLIDNFEWERGWTQRFGLWGLENDTQKRIRRPSVDLYQTICQSNAISSSSVSKFAPHLYSKLFPE